MIRLSIKEYNILNNSDKKNIKNKTPRKHDERDIQIAVVAWIKKETNLCVIGNMNESMCTVWWRKILHDMGLVKGTSDLFFPANTLHHKGLWLELKTKKGRATTSQIQFIQERISEGYAGHIAYGYDEAIMIIRTHYGL